MERLKASHWVAIVALDQIRLAAYLRASRGVEVLSCDGVVWLRGPLWVGLATAELEQRLLRLIPGVRPYWLDDDGQLTRLGALVPSAHLPRGTWIPFAEWLRIELPTPSEFFSGGVPQVVLSLTAGGDEREVTLLLTSLGVWSEYADSAPQWRLERLVFAMNGSQQVLIRGTPLPPLPGQRWVERSGIATPAGWTWTPEVSATVVRNKLGLEPGELALLDRNAAITLRCDQGGTEGDDPLPTRSHRAERDGYVRDDGVGWQVVRNADWVRATRSSVRLTVEAAHGT